MNPRNNIYVLFTVILFFNPAFCYCDEAVYIDSIEIINSNIFDLKRERLPFMPYGLINALHITTLQGVIRRELLFKPNTITQKHLIEESERRLRGFDFIRVADISIEKGPGGINKARVYTQDSWTTEPQFSMGGGGGENEYSFGIEEKNFLGLGKDIGYFYADDDEDVISRQIFYNDPHFLPGYWGLGSMYSHRSDGSIKEASLKRPFYELETKWAFEADLSNRDIEENIYKNNEQVSQLRTKKYKSGILAGIKLHSNASRATRIGGGYLYEESEYAELSSGSNASLPQYYLARAGVVKFEHIGHNFIKMKNINTFARIEDYNLGDELGIKVGYSPAAFGGSRDISLWSAGYNKGFLFAGNDFILLKEKIEGLYMDNKARNLVFESETNYYNKNFDKQTFAGNLLIKLGRNMDAGSEFTLGGLNGLRGYPAREFNGTKLLLVNLEDRFFWYEELLSLCGIGGLLFFDAGYVWGEGERIKFTDLKADAGFGLRLALTRSSAGLVLRLDFAYAMERIRDEKRFVVSFGSKQSF